MELKKKTTPDFLLIGAQRCGTTWLWKFLNEHPETDLPSTKEIHFFGGVEKYRNGKDWYYNHFDGLDKTKIIGEASSTYLYDRMPYWENTSDIIEFDDSLPCIPEIVKNELPQVKIMVILRDPVRRAISAYSFWLRKMIRNGNVPIVGLKKMALKYPKMRILEMGKYYNYLRLWKEYFKPDEIKIFIFEEDIVKNSSQMLLSVYRFLGLDTAFVPKGSERRVHKSSGITRLFFDYYTSSITEKIVIQKAGKFFDKYDFLRNIAISGKDIRYLQSIYKPEKKELESILCRDLSCWDYGEKLL